MPDVVLKNVRLSYAHLETPVSFDNTTKSFSVDEVAGNYSSVLIIPKGSDAEKALLKAIEEARSEALASGIRSGKSNVKVTAKDMNRFNDGIKDGDTKDDDVYADAIYINAKAKVGYKPKVYDKANVKQEDSSILYSGCYVNVYIRVYNYSAASNLGCSFGLTALQFHEDGEPLGNNVDTDSIFGDKAVADDEDMY